MATLLAPVSEIFITVCKKAYKPLVNENDPLLIGNWGALQAGLQAQLAEDASDFERAEGLWEKAKRLLISEENNLVGAGAQGVVQVQDDYEMEAFPIGL